MMKIHTKVCIGAALVVALVANSALAGTITHPLDVPPGPAPTVSGPGLGIASVPIVSTLSEGNDNQTGGGPSDNNIDVNLKRFDANDYIDIEFTVRPSTNPQAPPTEYRVVEFVDNNTGLPWVGYRVQLGFGTGAAFTLADPSAADPIRLDFDAPTFDFPPSSSAMGITSMTANELVYSGFHAAGAQSYNFRIDVPNLVGRETFTLRQIPVPIPEPATIGLLAVALMGLIGLKRSR
jgi:hypothetical protein